jgi:hypothetical protein
MVVSPFLIDALPLSPELNKALPISGLSLVHALWRWEKTACFTALNDESHLLFLSRGWL